MSSSPPNVQMPLNLEDFQSLLHSEEAQDFRNLLQYAMPEWRKDSNLFFLPADILDAISTDVVEKELRRIKPDIEESDYSTCARYISENSIRVFCLLARGHPDIYKSSIRTFVKDSIQDQHLPFHRFDKEFEGTLDKYALGKAGLGCHTSGHVNCRIGATKAWNDSMITALLRDQWAVLAPRFSSQKDKIPNLDLPESSILPFIEDNKESASQGGYGTVWQVRVHKAHHELGTTRPFEVSYTLSSCILATNCSIAHVRSYQTTLT